MENIKINQTPVRTSRNFNINNIKLEDIEIPEVVRKFDSLEIIKENAIINTNLLNENLTYGLGNKLENNVLENANHKAKIIVNEKDNIEINYNFDEDNFELINYLEIEANADCNITIKYESNTDIKCFHNGIIKLLANSNVNVNVVIINMLNNNSDNFEAIENIIGENSNVNYTIIDLGAKNSISNYYSNILGNNSNNDLKTIYLGKENQVKDINYIAHLKGEKTNIDIDVQGALKDNAKKNFKGTIDFKKGCKKAKGNENEFCILLSDKAKSIALPMLLCAEDDVEGNHSAASGKVDKKELFYIMSRGIKYTDAIKLLVRANFNKILSRIKDEYLRDKILNEIDNRLD